MRLSLGGRREKVMVDVEERSLRVLTVKDDEVQRWRQVPLEPGLIENGLIHNPEQVGRVLEATFEEQDFPKKGIISSLTVIGLGSTAHILNLPKMKPGLLGGAVAREAKRAMPIPVEQLYLSHRVIGERGGLQQVYVLGVPRDIMDAHVSAFKIAGIQLKAMDLKPLALVRAVNQRNAVIADLEDDNLHVIVVRNAIPDIMRSAVLHKESLDLQQKARRLVHEVTQTIGFYNRNHPDTPLEPSVAVFLTGELTAIPSVNKAIQTELGRAVEVPRPPLMYPEALPLPQFMVSIGLALKREI